MGRLEAYSGVRRLRQPRRRNELAERLAALAPDGRRARSSSRSGGGDAIDTAAKLARRYWAERGEPERMHLISRMHGYHGTHGYGTSLAGIEANRAGFGPARPGRAPRSPHDSLAALRGGASSASGRSNVAAFFCEPVIGAGGVLPAARGYIEGVAALCDEHGVLFVADCVICGFGRLGTWFGVERFGVEPDMIMFAKGVTSGYLPLGGVVVSGRVAEPFFAAAGAPVFRHGATYAGHPACCAAGLANIDIIEREGLDPARAGARGRAAAALAPLAAASRGRARCAAACGLLAAVELAAGGAGPTTPARSPASPRAPARRACWCARCRPRVADRRRR